MHMKKTCIMLIITMFLNLIPALAENGIVIYLLNDVQKSVPITDFRKITFSDTGMNLFHKNGNTESFALSSVKKILFSSTTDLNNSVINDKIEIYPNPVSDIVNFKNLTAGKHKIELYRPDGILIYKETLEEGSDFINISALNEGLYILRVDNNAIKIRKQ